MPAGLTRVRKPAVAGLFYPSQPAALLATVRDLLAEPHAVSEPAVAVLAPHAGYQYSGRTAAHVFARVTIPRVCIVLGPNHTGAGLSRHAGSAWAVGAFRTPLGDVPVEETVAAALLARCPFIEDDPDAHKTEHSVEVTLPLLVAQRPDVAIVPVLVGWTDWARTRALGEALAETVRQAGEPVLLVASSDMNHHESAEVGKQKDDVVLETVKRLAGEDLLEVTKKHRSSMCGRTPVAAVLHAAKLLGAMGGTVVHYSHSGEVTQDDRSVVGFAGVVIR